MCYWVPNLGGREGPDLRSVSESGKKADGGIRGGLQMLEGEDRNKFASSAGKKEQMPSELIKKRPCTATLGPAAPAHTSRPAPCSEPHPHSPRDCSC